MKSKKLLLLFVPAFLCACTEQKETPGSVSDVDAARNFIRASLNNDFKEANTYLLSDSSNQDLISMVAQHRGTLSKEENAAYKAASIRIYDTRKVDDSTSIVTYDNSFKKNRDSLKVVRRGAQWLVDLKYSLLGNDSTSTK